MFLLIDKAKSRQPFLHFETYTLWVLLHALSLEANAVEHFCALGVIRNVAFLAR